MDRWEKVNRRSKAYRLITAMIDRGELVKPDNCELCEYSYESETGARSKIVAHHWRGYEDDALTDVWFICEVCNKRLYGDRFHSGIVSREEAREYLENFEHKKPERGQGNICNHPGCKNHSGKNKKYCHHHGIQWKRLCQGVTRKGKSCGRRIYQGKYCHNHRKQAEP